MDILKVIGVEKWYGSIPGILDVNMIIKSDTVVGLLGANGAGKTTLLNMIAAQLRPSRGSIDLLGISVWRSPVEAKKVLGFVPDDDDLPDYLTGREYLLFVATVHGLSPSTATSKVHEALGQFDLLLAGDRLIKGYSHGMKKKLQVAAGMLHDPRMLIVDEPTNGLDPLSVRKLRLTLRNYASEGQCVLLATHDLAFASDLCDFVYIISNHRIVTYGTIAELLTSYQAVSLEDVYVRAV